MADDSCPASDELNAFDEPGGLPYSYDTFSRAFALGQVDPSDGGGFGEGLVAGLSGRSLHQRLAKLIGAEYGDVVAGHARRGDDGALVLDEGSGHFYMNWNDEARAQVVADLARWTGAKVVMRGWKAPR